MTIKPRHIERLTYLAITEFQDDAFSIEAVFEFIQDNIPKYQSLLRISSALQNDLWHELPQDDRNLQDWLTTELAQQSDIANTHVYSQGVCNAMRMYHQLPLSSINITAYDHMRMSQLASNTAYIQCEKRILHILSQIQEKHPTYHDLARACCNATNATDSLHAKYCYLWGIEFGLYLCKNTDPSYIEDEQYIMGVYNCLLSDNSPLLNCIGSTTH